jgi:hypothetical protein
MTVGNLGLILSLIIIFGGLLWLFIRSMKGKEVERRIIFVFIFIAVAAPVLFTITFQEHATPIVRELFEKVETLPPNSKILISFDYDPAMVPEVQPMSNAVLRHCFVRGHRVAFMCLWATGQSLLTTTLDSVVRRDFPNLVDGVDYVNVGYKAGNEGVLNVIKSNFKEMFPTDVNGVPLNNTELFRNIRSCADFDIIIVFGGGKPGPKEWVLFVGDPVGVPMGAGVAAVSAPQLYPYYPKQLVGILGGVKGAAEYEEELGDRYPQFGGLAFKPGLRTMGPQTLAHLVIMSFIIIGNIAYFRTKRRKKS